EHRHVDPLPAGAPAERIPRPARRASAAVAGDGARRGGGALASLLAGALGRRRARCGRGVPPRARAPRGMKRALRVGATLLVTSLAVAYILSKIDLGKTAHVIGSASIPWLVLSAALTLVTVPPMAWRWQRLLAARGVDDSVAWLTRAYFVSYAFGQVLPTSVGGDAW